MSRLDPAVQASATDEQPKLRIGIDLGGTKIAAIALARDAGFGPEIREATPRGNYDATVSAIQNLVTRLLEDHDTRSHDACVGIGIPGSLAPSTGRIQNANSTWLNGRDLLTDFQSALQVPVRIANDADCFALSEARDGAAKGARIAFGVILGTGCGGGLVLDGRLIAGPRATAGEWGHNPLPLALPDELPGPVCWCGRRGCLETWISGPGLVADYERSIGDTGNVTASKDGNEMRDDETITGQTIVARARSGDGPAQAALVRHRHRVARGLATIANLLDPDVIVLGGGISLLPGLVDAMPDLIAPHIFAADTHVEVRSAKWGDASGVRGAARLWP